MDVFETGTLRTQPLKLLQRHILSELLRVFIMLLIGLTVMLVFVGLLREATERGLGPRQVVQIMPFVVPSLLPFTIPATILLAVTVVYGRLAAELEVTAAKAAGIHPLRLLTPAFALGCIFTVVSFALTDQVIPWAITRIETIVTQAMEDIFFDVLKSQRYLSSPEDGYSVTVHDVDVDGRVLHEPTFKYRNSDHQQVTVTARAARVCFDVENRNVLLDLRDARVSMPGRENFGGLMKHHLLQFDLKEELGATKARHLNIEEIRRQLVTLREASRKSRLKRDQEVAMLLVTGDFEQLIGDSVNHFESEEFSADFVSNRMRTEIHSRYAMAGSCLFFTFLGGPFAILQARRQFVTSFILCFLPILLIYYPVVFLMLNLARNGSFEPWWSVWIPNALIGIASLLVLRRVIRH